MTWLRRFSGRWTLFAASLLLAPLLSSCQTVPVSAPSAAGSFSPEQIAVLQSYDFIETDGQWELGLEGKLLFPFDQGDLAAEQRERLVLMAGRLLEIGIGGCRVDGHTDSIGNADYNRELSLRRAEAVKGALVAGGMAEGSVEARGMGSSHPIESNGTVEGRRQNRRVTIIVSPSGSYAF